MSGFSQAIVHSASTQPHSTGVPCVGEIATEIAAILACHLAAALAVGWTLAGLGIG